MKHNTFLFYVFTLLFLSACSSLHNKPLQQTHSGAKSDLLPLCVYKKEKGIAEVISIGESSYHFRFYLGDDAFEVNKNLAEINGKLKLGDELKAVKKVMVSEKHRQDCPALEFHLIH